MTPRITRHASFSSATQQRKDFLNRLQALQGEARKVAYLCMEFGGMPVPPPLNYLPIYSGGLGMLAGDTLKSAADLGLPLIGIGLLYRYGFYAQKREGNRMLPPQAQEWNPNKTPGLYDLTDALNLAVQLEIGGQMVQLRIWGYDVQGYKGNSTPLILLDSMGLPNPNGLTNITRQLYAPGPKERLLQEMVLGIGGVRALGALGLYPSYVHSNEGHAGFAAIELLRELEKPIDQISPEDIKAIQAIFSFTTHTPVKAGFDIFHRSLIETYFSDYFLKVAALKFGADPNNRDFTNMAYIAMRLSGVLNGVSQLHARVSNEMFPDFAPFLGITNGVHHITWVSRPIRELLNKNCPTWEANPQSLQELMQLSSNEAFRKNLWDAHQAAKQDLLEMVEQKTGTKLDSNIFTLAWARRFASYKRPDLILQDKEELLRLAQEYNGLQIIFAGKPHFADDKGMALLTKVLQEESNGLIKIIFIPGYDVEIAKILVAGVDAWLNNPIRPMEASGTSGMKAAMNAVPQISTDDGWWVERRGGGITINEGKILSPTPEDPALYVADSQGLYAALRQAMNLYHKNRPAWVSLMLEALAQNGSFFNTHRMLEEYQERVFNPTRINPSRQENAKMPTPSSRELRKHIIKTIFTMASLNDRVSVQSAVAEAIMEALSGQIETITRYDVHRTSVRLATRWQATQVGESIVQERLEILDSAFQNWREQGSFHGEVMETLLKTGNIQVVMDPAKDPRCFRDGKLASPQPFILLPKKVDGRILGVYKVNFRFGAPITQQETDYLEDLMEAASRAETQILQIQMEEDLQSQPSKQDAINWGLTLGTGGGFQDMKRYAKETNRAVFFEATPAGLIGTIGVGATSQDEHFRDLGTIVRDLFKEHGIETALRKIDHSKGSLSQLIRDKNLGSVSLPGYVLYQNGSPYYETKDMANFPSSQLEELRTKIESLFQTDGKTVAEYLLVPVIHEGKVLGLLYFDNVFSPKNHLHPENYTSLAVALGKALARHKQ